VSPTPSGFSRGVAALARAGVEFVVVGVGGINFYARDGAHAFATLDLDLLLAPERDNLRRARDARRLHVTYRLRRPAGRALPFVHASRRAAPKRLLRPPRTRPARGRTRRGVPPAGIPRVRRSGPALRAARHGHGDRSTRSRAAQPLSPLRRHRRRAHPLRKRSRPAPHRRSQPAAPACSRPAPRIIPTRWHSRTSTSLSTRTMRPSACPILSPRPTSGRSRTEPARSSLRVPRFRRGSVRYPERSPRNGRQGPGAGRWR